MTVFQIRQVIMRMSIGYENSQNGPFQHKMSEKLRKLKITTIAYLFLLTLLQTWFWPIFTVFGRLWRQHFYLFEENAIF